MYHMIDSFDNHSSNAEQPNKSSSANIVKL